MLSFAVCGLHVVNRLDSKFGLECPLFYRLFPGEGGSSSLDSSNQTVGPVHPFHPKIVIRRGVLATECSEVMQQFFQLRRRKNKKPEPSPPSSLAVSNHPTKFFTKIHDLFSVMFCL